MNFRSIALAPLLASLSLVGCGDKSAGPAVSSSSSSGAKPSSAAEATATATAAQTAPPAAVTTGEVEARGGKGKVAYAIELPEGLKDFSERPSMKTYSRVKQDLADKSSFEGYSFIVAVAPPGYAKGGVEPMLKRAEADPTFPKNNGKILDKGSTSDGWYMVVSIEEGGKKAVTLSSATSKGDVELMCRGDFTGPGADKTEEVAATLVKTCKSLRVTSP